jgi:hypothetical protein
MNNKYIIKEQDLINIIKEAGPYTMTKKPDGSILIQKLSEKIPDDSGSYRKVTKVAVLKPTR